MPTRRHSPPSHACHQVYAFSRCGFCHPDLINVVETAAGTLLKEAAADGGYVSARAWCTEPGAGVHLRCKAHQLGKRDAPSPSFVLFVSLFRFVRFSPNGRTCWRVSLPLSLPAGNR